MTWNEWYGTVVHTGPTLATIVFNDILNYPLTAWEVFALRIKEDNADTHAGTLCDTLRELEQLKAQKIIEEKSGFYFLAWREVLYEERIEKMKIADEKWRSVRRLLSAMRMVPFIRGVALSGSMGRGAAVPGSDIDLFVITEKNRIWTGRLFLTLFALLSWRLRPGQYTRLFFPFVRHGKGESVADKICLHQYASPGAQLAHRNLYTATLHAVLTPLWGGEFFERLFKENAWIRGHLPNAVFGAENRRMFKLSLALQKVQWAGEFALQGILGNLFEKTIGGIQKFLIAYNPLTKVPGNVVIEERELAFHPNTRDRDVLDKFAHKMVELFRA